MSFERIGGETIVLFQDLRERLETAEAMRSISSLAGEFTTKTVKGGLYHYFQAIVPGGRVQIYLGRDSKETRRLIEERSEGRTAVEADIILFQRLVSQIIAGGVPPVPPDTGRIIRRLADSAVFRVGGVLVGSVAFHIICTHLGVNPEQALRTTQDIDIAGDTRIAVAVPGERADIPAAIDSLRMGFFPVPRLSNKEPSTSFAIRGKTLRIDMLTPMKRGGSKPVFIPRLNVAAQPLKYLDYLLEDPLATAMVCAEPCMVKVPQPARFALHKLIVSNERDITSAGKKGKDIAQASVILDVLRQDRPGDIEAAREAMAHRHASWMKKLDRACKNAGVKL